MKRIKEFQVTLRPYVEASKRVDGRNIEDVKFYSRDTNSSYIRFFFQENNGTPLILDNSYVVKIRLRFYSDDTAHESLAIVQQDGSALYYFDTDLITGFDNVEVFVYLEKEDKKADIYSFTIKVDLSEADKKSSGERIPIVKRDELEATKIFIQSVASSRWTILHGMNKYPSVTIVDSSGQKVEGADVVYISRSKIEIFFSASFSGKAFLN